MSDRRTRKPIVRRSPRLLRVGMACNGDQGIFAGKVDAISVERGGERLDMDGMVGARLTLAPDESWLRIFRRKMRVHGAKDWVGNWCWNEYTLEQPAVAFLLVTAQARGYGFDGATGDEAIKLGELIEAGAPVALVLAQLDKLGAPAR